MMKCAPLLIALCVAPLLVMVTCLLCQFSSGSQTRLAVEMPEDLCAPHFSARRKNDEVSSAVFAFLNYEEREQKLRFRVGKRRMDYD